MEGSANVFLQLTDVSHITKHAVRCMSKCH